MIVITVMISEVPEAAPRHVHDLGRRRQVRRAQRHDALHVPREPRGKRLHTRNRHLGNPRGFSMASPNGLSAAFSSGISLVSGISQRIATCPVNVSGKVQWIFSGIVQWIFSL